MKQVIQYIKRWKEKVENAHMKKRMVSSTCIPEIIDSVACAQRAHGTVDFIAQKIWCDNSNFVKHFIRYINYVLMLHQSYENINDLLSVCEWHVG